MEQQIIDKLGSGIFDEADKLIFENGFSVAEMYMRAFENIYK